MTATEAYEFNISLCAETEDVLAFFRARGGGGTAGVTSTAAQTRVRCPFATIAPSAGRGPRYRQRREQSEMKSSLYSQQPLTLASVSHNT